MTESDPLRKYVEAGIAFTQLTRARAEAIVKELVKAGDLQREQTQDRVEELLDRSRKSTEGLMGLIRKEISQQLSSMGFATKADLEGLEARLEARLAAAVPEPEPKAARKASATRPAKATTPPPGTAARKAGPQKAARRRSGPNTDGRSGPSGPSDKA